MAVLLIIHCQNQNLPFHKETMFILGLTCLIIGIEQLSHPVVTQYIERLTQPTPPLERRRVVVRRQQLKRLENCVWPVSVWAVQAYEENNITTDTGIMLRHFWTCSNQEAANQATANGNQAVGETKANKESQTADVLESGKEAVGKTKAIDSQSTPATNKDATPATDKQSICGQETGPQFN